MILGFGTDIVAIKRIENLIQRLEARFLQKVFTESEQVYALSITNFSKRAAFYAKRFSAKEAFSKACGLGIGRGINFIDIEVYNNQNGKPLIRILNNKDQFLRDYFSTDFIVHLSLSDEKEIAQASVIIESNNL